MVTSATQTSKPRHPLLETLSANFPAFRNVQPLAIGIHKAIKARLPDIADAELRNALRVHTASTRYLKALANAKQRVDLEGNPGDEITAEQRKQAQETLKERFRKTAERKKTEQEAREREAKLQQLVDKFSRR